MANQPPAPIHVFLCIRHLPPNSSTSPQGGWSRAYWTYSKALGSTRSWVIA